MSDILNKILTGLRKDKITTAFGSGALISGIIQIGYSFDADPSTVTDWVLALGFISAGLGLTSSQDAKPKPPTT